MPNLSHIATQFQFPGAIDNIKSYGSGIINDTFVVTFSNPVPASHSRLGKRAILQRINNKVFPQPTQVMHNLAEILTHVAEQDCSGLPGNEFLLPPLYTTHDGNSYFQDRADRHPLYLSRGSYQIYNISCLRICIGDIPSTFA